MSFFYLSVVCKWDHWKDTARMNHDYVLCLFCGSLSCTVMSTLKQIPSNLLYGNKVLNLEYASQICMIYIEQVVGVL